MRKKSCAAVHTAIQILRLHRGQIEEHHNQAVIAQLFRIFHHSGFRSVAAHACGQSADRRFIERRGHLHVLKIKRGNLLPLAVLKNHEVALLESAQQLAGLCIVRHYIGQHQLAVRLEHNGAIG